MFGVETVYAASPDVHVSDPAYHSEYMTQSIHDPISIPAGDSKKVTVTFKNIGTATWYSTGRHFVSAYTMIPRYHDSIFAGNDWIAADQPVKIDGTIAPGEIGTVTIDLHAPNKPGEYQEDFYLASEMHTWMRGGYFYFKIHVTNPRPAVSSFASSLSTTTVDATTAIAKPFDARIISQSMTHISAVGGARIPLILDIQNGGSMTWSSYAIIAQAPVRITNNNTTGISFGDTSWVSQSVVVDSQQIVAPNKILKKTVIFRAPSKAGTYKATFYIQVAGQVFPSAVASVTIDVTSNALAVYRAPVLSKDSLPVLALQSVRLASEPYISVGLWEDPKESVLFRSMDDVYLVFAGTQQMGQVPIASLATLTKKGESYIFSSSGLDFTTNKYIRLQPKDNPHAIFTITNLDRHISWKGSTNFNEYHGAVEYRSSINGAHSFIINDLLLSDYVKGVAENDNNAPIEYLKAQMVVERTYAYYIAKDTNKHTDDHFDVSAGTADQLYLGVLSEQVMPNFVSAVQATRGYMVTYDTDNNPATANAVVITPYFGHSDGHTRSWSQVWGGSAKPWLVSVPAQYDQGLSLYGHGVGMSQNDAMERAKKEGLNWKQLLTYYYRGTSVEKMYY